MTNVQDLEELEDDALVSYFKATRNNQFFDVLFRRHCQTIYCACLKVLRDRHMAEDVTQETFTTAFTQIDSYQNGVFQAWIYTIARNHCLNLIKRNRRMLPEDFIPKDQAQASDLSDGGPAAEVVIDILNRLPTPQRTALKLLFIDGYSYKEIARIMGIPVQQVKSHIQNGKRRFGRFWIDNCEAKKSEGCDAGDQAREQGV